MIEYDYEDVKNLPLTREATASFLLLIAQHYPNLKDHDKDYFLEVGRLDSGAYKYRLEYIMADTVLQRAYAAANSPPGYFKQKVLILWKK